eukprot:2987431-Prymnesium_polylepis.1
MIYIFLINLAQAFTNAKHAQLRNTCRRGLALFYGEVTGLGGGAPYNGSLMLGSNADIDARQCGFRNVSVREAPELPTIPWVLETASGACMEYHNGSSLLISHPTRGLFTQTPSAHVHTAAVRTAAFFVWAAGLTGVRDPCAAPVLRGRRVDCDDVARLPGGAALHLLLAVDAQHVAAGGRGRVDGQADDLPLLRDDHRPAGGCARRRRRRRGR